MKKRTGILINSAVIMLGYTYENYFLMFSGLIILSLVLISKSKRYESK